MGMTMKLWLLRPQPPYGYQLDENPPDDPWSPWYDRNFGFVIRAETEENARGFASVTIGEENGTGTSPWLDEKYSSCILLESDGEESIIIKDFWSA